MIKAFKNQKNTLQNMIQIYRNNPSKLNRLNKVQNLKVINIILQSQLNNYFNNQLMPIIQTLTQNVIKDKQFYYQDISQVITLLTKFNIYNSRIYKIFESHFNKHGEFYKPINLVSVYWSYVKLSVNNIQIQSKLRNYIVQCLKEETNPEFVLQCLYILICSQNLQRNFILRICNHLIYKCKKVTSYSYNICNKLIVIGSILRKLNIDINEIKQMQRISLILNEMNYKFKRQFIVNYEIIDQDTAKINIFKLKGKHNSITEILIAQQLTKNYYLFDKSVFIGGYQFDFLIKGRIKVKKPFKKINQTQNQIQQKFQPMILQMHGPNHFIISDVSHNHDKLSRNNSIKMQILRDSNITRYNFINYREWQKIQKIPNEQRQYIQKLISNPIKIV